MDAAILFANEGKLRREAISRWGFAEFVRQFWPVIESKPLRWNWHHDLICKHLEAVTRGQILKLRINIPPGCTKTSLVSRLWPVWHWIQKPSDRILASSYDAQLTADAAGDDRGSMKVIQDPVFMSAFPEVEVKHGAAQSLYFNTAGGLRLSTSTAGRATGYHGDVKIVDDPIKPRDVNGKMLTNCADWYGGTWSSRDNSESTAEVIVMQRLAENDLCGDLDETEKTVDQGGPWVNLVLPMRFDPDRRFVSPLGLGADPRTFRGELLWPDRFPEALVKALEKRLGPQVVSAQFDQNPVPAGGNLFKGEWFREYDHENPPHFTAIYVSVDCTFKDSATSDRVAIGTWGRPIQPHLYLWDATAERLSFLDTLDALADTLKRIRRRFPGVPVAVLIEDKANGSAVIDTAKKQVPGVIPITPTESKYARAQACTGYVRAGDIYIPRNAPWAPEYKREMVGFPRAKFDDQVDQTSQIIRYAFGEMDLASGIASQIAALSSAFRG